MTATLVPSTAETATGITVEMTTVALTATRTTTFLRAQTQWLQRGLDRSNDPVAVAVVLGAHDRSHDRWVGMIHQVEAVLGSDVAAELSSLYAVMGRVAGALEHRATELLCPTVARDVRDLLSQRLGDRTEAVVEHVWRAAALV